LWLILLVNLLGNNKLCEWLAIVVCWLISLVNLLDNHKLCEWLAIVVVCG